MKQHFSLSHRSAEKLQGVQRPIGRQRPGESVSPGAVVLLATERSGDIGPLSLQWQHE